MYPDPTTIPLNFTPWSLFDAQNGAFPTLAHEVPSLASATEEQAPTGAVTIPQEPVVGDIGGHRCSGQGVHIYVYMKSLS